MHGDDNIKFINAQQAWLVYRYRNIKEELLKINASIWFNKVCRNEQLQPRYISIKVNSYNRRSQNTKQAAVKYRINVELKHLYKKKTALNKQLYESHLNCANYLQESWYWIQRSEHQKSKIKNDILYNKLNKKLDTLRYTQKQQNKPQGDPNTETNTTFYTQIKNVQNNIQQWRRKNTKTRTELFIWETHQAILTRLNNRHRKGHQTTP